MKRIGVMLNPGKPDIREWLPRLIAFAAELDLHLEIDENRLEDLSPPEAEALSGWMRRADAILTLGGDGTLLRAVRYMGDHPIPIFGVNFGKLGFLTSVTQHEIQPALAALASGKLLSSRRPLVECRFRNPGETDFQHARALNDVVLSWGKSSHMADLDVRVNGEKLTRYSCDGLIVATPTGSTGHSLSAGGPILSPDTRNLLLCPICPHSMTVRPVVLSGESEINVCLAANSKALVLACDGQPLGELGPGAEVSVRFGPLCVELLQLPGYQYWDVLRRKLNWRGNALE